MGQEHEMQLQMILFKAVHSFVSLDTIWFAPNIVIGNNAAQCMYVCKLVA